MTFQKERPEVVWVGRGRARRLFYAEGTGAVKVDVERTGRFWKGKRPSRPQHRG